MYTCVYMCYHIYYIEEGLRKPNLEHHLLRALLIMTFKDLMKALRVSTKALNWKTQVSMHIKGLRNVIRSLSRSLL